MSLTAGFSDGTRGPTITTATAIGLLVRSLGGAIAPANTAWPANNQAYLIPFQLAGPFTVVKAFFHAGTTPGTTNFDLGLYDETFKLITSLGATASVNTTNAILPAGGGAFPAPVTLSRGRYYMAMSAASTGLTVLGHTLGNQTARAVGLLTMATAHPLPATFVPVSMGTSGFCPHIGMMTNTTIL